MQGNNNDNKTTTAAPPTLYRLEEKLEACRCELHERERQLAEAHITHQVHARARGNRHRCVLPC